MSIRRICFYLALLLLELPTLSLAQGGTRAPNMFFSRVWSQAVVHAIPDGWKLVQQGASADGARYTLNYAPEGASPSSWTELITVTGFKDMAKDPKASPAGMVEYLARQKRAVCPDRAVAISAGDVMLGQRRGNIAIVGCGQLPSDIAGIKAGEGEISLHIVISGDKDMYVITRLQRVAPYEPSAEPISKEVFGRLVRELLPAGICELNDTPAQCQPKLGGKR
jgi:hypothetical protein